MAIATLIIPVSEGYPQEVDEVVKIHKRQTIDVDIVVSVCNPFNISKARNLGAVGVKTEWLLFADADTYFDADLFGRMVNLGSDAVAGKTRRDILTIGAQGGHFYHCGFAPLLIKRCLFEQVGGYCEEYPNYGYEDSDFEHKLPAMPTTYDSKAYHVMAIHNKIAKAGWNVNPNANKVLFERRLLTMTKEDRIKADKCNANIAH